MILAVTGHRPDKLGGYGLGDFLKLKDFAKARLRDDFKPHHVITGMAQGWDQAVAQACFELSIPFTAAIPFHDFPNKWPEQSRVIFYGLCYEAQHMQFVCEPGYAAWKMQARNEWMVDRADHVMALWDGSHGGTRNCVVYAHQKSMQVTNLWPFWEAAA